MRRHIYGEIILGDEVSNSMKKQLRFTISGGDQNNDHLEFFLFSSHFPAVLRS